MIIINRICLQNYCDHVKHLTSSIRFVSVFIKLSLSMDTVRAAKKIIDQNHSNGNDNPFFILNLKDVKRKYEIWRMKITRVVPYYAVKCNDDDRVLKLLRNLGTGFDCASMSELTKILNLKVDPQKIIYANTVKQVSHLKLAADNGIFFFFFLVKKT